MIGEDNMPSHALSQSGRWTNGNGHGSEKWDTFEEIARFSKDQESFLKHVSQDVNLASENSADAEPKGHPMGVYLQTDYEPPSSELSQERTVWDNVMESGDGPYDHMPAYSKTSLKDPNNVKDSEPEETASH